MISFLQLHYFIVVADSCNFSAAAKRLYISQQTLSGHIAQMESDLGVILFNRTRPLTLTPAGEQLYKRAEEILFLHRQAKQEMQNFSEGRCNNLRIGIASSYARTLLPELFPSLVENCPNIKLELFERNFSDLSDLLTHHKVDLIITRPPYPCNTVTIPLIDESISIYAPKAAIENNFSNRSEEIIKQLSEKADLWTLRDCLFILPRSGSVRDSCDKLFWASQISPHILVETDFMETAIAFSRTGMGITLAPTGMLQALEKQLNDDQKVTDIYPIAKKSISRNLALCYPDRAVVSPAMQKFIAIARARLSKHNFNKLN